MALPGPAITNVDLAAFLERHQAAVRGSIAVRLAERLAVRTRHLCRELTEPVVGPRARDSNPELSARALRQALNDARLDVHALGFLIGHTTTPHTLLPPNVGWVADLVGYDGPFVELRQACTGFAAALVFASGMLAQPQEKPVAIVGSETGSVFFDPRCAGEDREQLLNLVQMGDGAGAAILAPVIGQSRSTIAHVFYGSLGHGHEPGLGILYGGSAVPITNGRVNCFSHRYDDIKQLGPELFAAGIRAAGDAGIELRDIDWFLPHQVNGRMDQILRSRFGIPAEKVVVTADRFGNLGSAAIWTSLDWLRRSGRLQPGDRVLILGAESTKYMFGGFVYTH
jgi:3-oxoacyl-[acyl-carrier-protein] synthase-3